MIFWGKPNSVLLVQVVVKLYQNLAAWKNLVDATWIHLFSLCFAQVERPPPAPFHRDRMVGFFLVLQSSANFAYFVCWHMTGVQIFEDLCCVQVLVDLVYPK